MGSVLGHVAGEQHWEDMVKILIFLLYCFGFIISLSVRVITPFKRYCT